MGTDDEQEGWICKHIIETRTLGDFDYDVAFPIGFWKVDTMSMTTLLA